MLNLTQAMSAGLAILPEMRGIFSLSSPGVYAIYNKANGKHYIGSSCNMRERLWRHTNMLMLGTHYNKHLQNAHNKYGWKCFGIKVMELVSDNESLFEREQYYIDKLAPEYNKCPTAGGTRGYRYNKSQSKKQSERLLREWRTGHRTASQANKEAARTVGIGNRGRKHGKYSPARVAKITGGNSPVSKLAEADVVEIKRLLSETDMKHREIAAIYGVTRGNITAINRGKTWGGVVYEPGTSINTCAGSGVNAARRQLG